MKGSLRTRLLAGVMISIAFVLCIFCLIIYTATRQMMFRHFDKSLLNTAKMLSGVIEDTGYRHHEYRSRMIIGDPNRRIHFEFDDSATPEFHNLGGGAYYQFSDANEVIIVKSPSLGTGELNIFEEISETAQYSNYTLPDGSNGRVVGFKFIPKRRKNIKVEFTNDRGDQNRDVQVDYIIVDGVTYQAEDQLVNTGVWLYGRCGGSYSEMLECDGYIKFDIETEPTPTPTPAPAPMPGDDIVIQENEAGFCYVEGLVESDRSGYTGSGFANTENFKGTGINYKAIISATGTYTFSFRYANGSSFRSAKLVVNGSTVASRIDFESTGGWTNWDAESVSVYLNAGVKDIRLEATNNSGLANIDYIQVIGPRIRVADCSQESTAVFIPAPTPQLGSVLEVELESLSDQSQFTPLTVINDSDASGGQAIVWPDEDNVALRLASDDADGQIQISFTLSQETDVQFHIQANFSSGTNNSFYYKMDSGSWSIQNQTETSGYEILQPATFNNLSAGSHTLRICRREDGSILDKVILTASAGTISSDSSTPTPIPTPIPPSGTLPWTETFDSEPGSRFSITAETRTWSSQSIDISGASSVSISAEIEGVDASVMDISDCLNLYYSINGGSKVAWSQDTEGFTLKTVSVSGLSGNLLQVHIEGVTSYLNETYHVDNIHVTADDGLVPMPTPTPTPAPTSIPTDYIEGFGKNTTGGTGGITVTVSSGSQFADYVSRKGRYIIRIRGSISLLGMQDVASNKTIEGLGSSGAIIGGGLRVKDASNVIIRNLHFSRSIDDAVTIETSTNVWVDHCTFDDCSDGQLDIKRASDFITISWCHFKDHQHCSLVGHSDNNRNQDKGRLRVTYHHNYFDGTSSQHPRVRFSALCHVYNNYYKNNSDVGIASTCDAEVLVEGCYFEGVDYPTLVGYASSSEGDLVARGNIYDNSGNPQTRGLVPSPPYSYLLDNTAEVKDIVLANCGVGGGAPTPAPTATPTPTPTPEPGRILEVELESLSGQSWFSPFSVINHSTASGGQAIVWPDNSEDIFSSPSGSADGQVLISFTLSQRADVQFEIRANLPDGTNDSFFYKMDSGSWSIQNSLYTSGYEIFFPATYDNLSAGEHTLRICRREDGALLDKVILTASAGTILSDLPTPTPSPGNIIVRAKGVVGDESVSLLINDRVVAAWTMSTSYQDYSAHGSIRNKDSSELTFSIVVARNIKNISNHLQFLGWLLLISSAAIIMLSTIIALFVTRAGIAPIRTLADEISAIDPDNLGQTNISKKYPKELLPINKCLNTLLEKIKLSFDRERQFNADIAHELRTPLAGIQSTIEVSLAKARKSKDYQAALQASLQITKNMHHIIDTLLSLGKLESGQISINDETITLKNIVADCWKSLEDKAQKREITFENDIAEDLICLCDKDQLTMVLSNILDNAVEYSNRGGKVWAKAESLAQSIIISISNTGCKLKQADIASIFNAFWRGDESRSQKDKHCGIGLTVVQRIVKVMGGNVTVQIEPDEIFTLSISLPV